MDGNSMDGKNVSASERSPLVIYLRRRADWEYLREDFADEDEKD